MDRPRTILVVEDTGACATTLEIALGQINGLDIQIVSTAEEAQACLDNGGARICAIVTDVHLPRDSGLDLIRWVRSRESSARLPIIVISGDSDPETPAATLQLGANAYFAKPFSPSEVRHKLEDLIDAELKTPPAA